MTAPVRDLTSEVAAILADLGHRRDRAELHRRLETAAKGATAEQLARTAQSYKDEPDVVTPLYERVVALEPDNAQALVLLANAYWLQGRGPEVVGELATRAIAADPSSRGAWHLWALAESNPRRRLQRWQQVAARFPADDLALAAMADNAAAVAGAEHDYAMVDLAVTTYEQLLARAAMPAQRDAIEAALRALKGWRF